jgi:DNA-binding MarR family transcriptional regulator
MNLEQSIQQTEFASLQQKSIINIVYTANWLNGLITRFLKTYKISPEQFNVLRILRGNHPKSLKMNEISERMLDKMSNATRLVEKLRSKNLCHRETNPDNRREVKVWISEKGLELLAKIDEKMPEQANLIEAITDEEATFLNLILDKLRSKS